MENEIKSLSQVKTNRWYKVVVQEEGDKTFRIFEYFTKKDAIKSTYEWDSKKKVFNGMTIYRVNKNIDIMTGKQLYCIKQITDDMEPTK